MDKIAHCIDEKDAFTNRDGNKLFFQTPNVPLWMVEGFAKALLAPRATRVEKRASKIETKEKRLLAVLTKKMHSQIKIGKNYTIRHRMFPCGWWKVL